MWSLLFITAVSLHATVALAMPVFLPDSEETVQIFKRNDPLTPEDLVLAELHEVNTTESASAAL